MCHWVACLWGLLAGLEGEGAHTWLSQARIDKRRDCVWADDDAALASAREADADARACAADAALESPLSQYAIALYFSV